MNKKGQKTILMTSEEAADLGQTVGSEVGKFAANTCGCLQIPGVGRVEKGCQPGNLRIDLCGGASGQPQPQSPPSPPKKGLFQRYGDNLGRGDPLTVGMSLLGVGAIVFGISRMK